MPLVRVFERTVVRTRRWPAAVRYLATSGILAVMMTVRFALSPLWPTAYPFMVFTLGILVTASLFDFGAGLFATVVSALITVYFYLPPVENMHISRTADAVALLVFCVIGLFSTAVIETLHHLVAELRASQKMRALQLREFQHRTRNDLASIVSLLHLRARAAGPGRERDGLLEGAHLALSLARVQTWLTTGLDDVPATIDTRRFLTGLASDLEHAHSGGGMRPVELSVHAEEHHIDTERAVQVGMMLNETVVNALKYAFPPNGAGGVTVTFVREGDAFVLEVTDTGVGVDAAHTVDPTLPRPLRGGGTGTRLLRALAVQLRGSFARVTAGDGGTRCTLRFPVAPPVAPALLG